MGEIEMGSFHEGSAKNDSDPSHMLHVWNICLRLGRFVFNVGNYSIHGASGNYIDLKHLETIAEAVTSETSARFKLLI